VQNGRTWRVSSAVDTELPPADPGEDLIKFGIEVAVRIAATSRWWEPLFAGFGGEPAFALYRLRLLGASPPEFVWMRPTEARRPWREVLEHLLAART
jgi:hypothetical protein